MRNIPVRTMGESESRMLTSSLDELSDKEYVERKKQLLGVLPIDSPSSPLNDELLWRDSLLKNLTRSIVDTTPIFIVEHDWFKAMSVYVKDLKEQDVKLPFKKCVFKFMKLDTPMMVTALQEGDEIVLDGISVLDSSKGSEVTYDELLKCVIYTCLAIEIEVAKHTLKESIVKNKDSTIPEKPVAQDVYWVRAILGKQVNPSDQTSVGMKRAPQRFHFRRGHWRVREGTRFWVRSYFAGNIDLGQVFKDYKI